MRTALFGLALLLLQGGFDRPGSEVDPVPERFRLQRALAVPAGTRGQACAVMDAAVYAHTDGRLTALRLYRMEGNNAAAEVPFALTESGEAGQQEEPARVLNLGRQGKAIVFDLEMPQRAYTSVVLSLDGRDFYAAAHVWGSDGVGGARTDLGSFPLFDLRSQGLSRSTALPLQEVSFPLLHVELTVTAAPGTVGKFEPAMVTGAQVPPSRQAQMLYTVVAETNAISTKGHESVASLAVPAHVPLERASFVLPSEFTKNFSREVRLVAYPRSRRTAPLSARDPYLDETAGGTIQRVRLRESPLGESIRSEQTTIEALLGANLRSDATVEVAVENGDDAPLPLQAIQLAMRQRKLCFDAAPGSTYAVRYGDTAPVRAPVYDYARLFQPSESAVFVALGPEAPNPAQPAAVAQVERRTYTERHPELLWIALLAVISVLGTVAVRSAKQAGHH